MTGGSEGSVGFPRLVLASASSARRRLLTQAGFVFSVCPSDFDESSVAVADPSELVRLLSLGKARRIAERLSLGERVIGDRCQLWGSEYLVLGCDSVLAFGGEVFGKPESEAVAIARWRRMRGRVGDLCTGHTLIDLVQQRTLTCCRVTQVYFAEVSDRQIEAYVATGEPMQCAGAFAVEGRGGCFIERLDGCHTNVIGLSLPLLRQMLAELGYEVTMFWK